MSTREKWLLQIMICIGVVGAITVYLLLPQIKKNRTLNNDYDQVSVQAEAMELIIAQQDVVDSLESVRDASDDNWRYFKEGLSSYEVDSFINDLAKANSLNVTLLSIGDYTLDRSRDPEIVTEENRNDILLKSTILVNVNGDYEDVLAFIASINDKSKCIVISKCNTRKDVTMLLKDEAGNTVEDFEYYEAQLTLELYSVVSFDEWKAGRVMTTESEEGGEVVW